MIFIIFLIDSLNESNNLSRKHSTVENGTENPHSILVSIDYSEDSLIYDEGVL